MSLGEYDACGYWGNRPETASECATRLLAFLTCLAKVDPVFHRWFDLGRDETDAQARELQLNHEMVERLLEDRQHAVRGLGFITGLWTGGQRGRASSLHFSCGGTTDARGALIPNFWNMDSFPQRDPEASRILSSRTMSKILICALEAWSPIWGVVRSRSFQDDTSPPFAPEVGWITQLSVPATAIPDLPHPARVEPVGESTCLIVLTDDRFTGRNPVHARLAHRVTGLLRQSGLLEPVDYWSGT